MVTKLKTSTQMLGELENVLTRIRRLKAEAVANEPMRLNRRLSSAEQEENERRRDKVEQIAKEIADANAEAAQVRVTYAEAMANEQKPKPPGPSAALQALVKQRADKLQLLEQLGIERAACALDAAEGDAEAKKALSKCCEDQVKAEMELGNLALAIQQAENRDAEERREAADRGADEKHRAGLAAAEELIAWAEKFDNLLSYVAAHFARFPDLQKALAKSGADINTDLTNRLFTAASRDRAAKHAGLHRVLSMDATVDATPLATAFRSILRSAVRRHTVKGKEREHSN